MGRNIIPPRRTLLPKLQLTEVCKASSEGATKIRLPATGSRPAIEYFVRPTLVPGAMHNAPESSQYSQFNLFPVVLMSSGEIWPEALEYILSRLELSPSLQMGTCSYWADDLAAYARFINEKNIDWLNFPSQRVLRPTYRFNGHLKFLVVEGAIAESTARRRMGVIISFYRWLMVEMGVSLSHTPWRESDRYVEIRDAQGFKVSLKIKTTDLSIPISKREFAHGEIIDDGGKLKPLLPHEQEILIEGLSASGNSEMFLIHLLALTTGARIQTVLTFRVKDTKLKLSDHPSDEVRFPVGPGTGIDTKNNKRHVLHIPVWIYQMIQDYAQSDRARRRRTKALGGDSEEQYLFLSSRGSPLYQSKQEASTYNRHATTKYRKCGQAVRQFISEVILPYMRSKLSDKFHFQFHDTRATAGLNWTDEQLRLVERGQISLGEARDFVRIRLGHESSSVTDRYLKYRKSTAQMDRVVRKHEQHLKSLATSAAQGLI